MTLLLSPWIFAGEGMWIPLLLESQAYGAMQAAGLKLSASDVYNINQACLKDAVVLFGNGCTGEMISPNGLLITNHHCGYGRIQGHSTVDKDYLTDGFWAYSIDKELPNPGLTVSFLIRIEDVTEKVLKGVTHDMPDRQRAAIVDSLSGIIVTEAVKDTHYEAEIESFFFGRDYFLFVYEVFNDVRLVGNPPLSIGKFGGDTDNWVWPRHTGDFSLFRIYAGKDNKPAPYDPGNVPYKPKKYLTLSKQGVHEGDFTMVIGYPAKTEEYMYSDELAMTCEEILPAKIKMREERLRVMSEEMSKSPEVHLQYSYKYQSVSNAWKKWKGVVSGITRTNAIDEKIQLEKKLTCKTQMHPQHIDGFAASFQELSDFYAENKAGIVSSDLCYEALSSFEMVTFASKFVTKALSTMLHDTINNVAGKDQLRTMAKDFFKTVNLTIDKKTMPAILKTYFAAVDPQFFPEIYRTIDSRFRGDISGYIDWMFDKSLFSDADKLNSMINKASDRSIKKLLSDPAIRFYQSFANELNQYYPVADSLDLVLERLYREYLNNLISMDSNGLYYPDANFTMRVAFGKVEGYKAADAIAYDYYTTVQGIIEKEDPAVADYAVNEKLKQTILTGDYGFYGNDSIMPVCFIASNHTSGGNSGSPVLDAEGRLIGINFDRNWEGTVSDYEYDPAVCRNISLDIRYVLFIIDRIAGASNLLQELTIE